MFMNNLHAVSAGPRRFVSTGPQFSTPSLIFFLMIYAKGLLYYCTNDDDIDRPFGG